MGRIRVTALVALPFLTLLACAAFAQVLAPPAADNGTAEGARDKRAVETCQESGGSRARPRCKPEPTVLRTEQAVKLSIELPPLPNAQCDAIATTEYQQRNIVARVSGTLKITDCAAASGAYTVAVRVRGENGEIEPLEFSETWQRADDQDVKFAADYAIGDNVELVNVRVRDVRCTCAESPSAEAPPASLITQ